MNAPPELTDRVALERARARVASDADLFLHREAARDLEERLQEVNRTFTAAAVVAGLPLFWSQVMPDAKIVKDSDLLDLAPASHDLVVHALALHWANDPVGQLVQARRALRPDGLFICLTFGGQSLHELRIALAEAETRISGGLSPRVAPMGEIRDLGALLQRAGFALPVADATPLAVTYRDMSHLLSDLRMMGERNVLTARLRTMSRRDVFDEAARIYRQTFPTAEGGIRATFEIVTLTGWAPGPSQPRPLRPGSATARLADALGTVERPAGDDATGGTD